MTYLLQLLPDVFMIFGGILPYLPQYAQIQQTKSTGSFSKHVCLVLLIANSLRIFFRYGEIYEAALLIQAIFMILAMIALTEVCVRMQPKDKTSKCLSDFNPEDFWMWTNFIDYVHFLVLFWIISAFITFIFANSPLYFTILGSISLGTESLLATPQLYKNYQKQSTAGMSIMMVLGWLVGDLFKVFYFVLLSQPIQFIACGAVQVTVDLLIIAQVFFYRSTLVTVEKASDEEELLTSVDIET